MKRLTPQLAMQQSLDRTAPNEVTDMPKSAVL